MSASSEFAHILGNTDLVACFAFWKSRRDGHRIPLKRDIDPVDMPRFILPNVFLYEREPDGRFRCRLFGSHLASIFQQDATGRYLDELLPSGKQSRRLKLFAQVIERQVPAAYSGRLVEGKRSWVGFSRLLLPVGTIGATADLVFGMTIFPRLSHVVTSGASDESLDAEAFATEADLADGVGGLVGLSA